MKSNNKLMISRNGKKTTEKVIIRNLNACIYVITFQLLLKNDQVEKCWFDCSLSVVVVVGFNNKLFRCFIQIDYRLNKIKPALWLPNQHSAAVALSLSSVFNYPNANRTHFDDVIWRRLTFHYFFSVRFFFLGSFVERRISSVDRRVYNNIGMDGTCSRDKRKIKRNCLIIDFLSFDIPTDQNTHREKKTNDNETQFSMFVVWFHKKPNLTRISHKSFTSCLTRR